MSFEALFQAGRIGGLTLANRLIMAPMESNLAGPDGTVSPRMVAYYGERAAGGVGLVTVEYTCVDRPLGQGGSPQAALDDDAQVPGHRTLVQAIHAGGAGASVQLFHAGRQTLRRFTDGRAPVAASAIACKVYREPPEEMSVVMIGEVTAKFAAAARRAVLAGYDAIEIHGAHGYLIGGFLSPATNRRSDEYGGSLENRLRFPLALVRAVKAAAGSVPVIFRLSADEFIEGGTQIDEACLIALALEAAGVDAIHVSTGTAESMDRNVDPVSAPEGWRLPLARRIRDVVGVPVIAVGVIRDPAVAAAAIERGDADFIALGRALLADPQWPAKARDGLAATIRPCTSCNWCVDQIINHQPIGCAENPRAGRETAPQIRRLAMPGARAVVVGGGPGGMVAALLLDQAGYRVSLFERAAELGSGLTASAMPPDKEKFRWYRDYLIARIGASGVELRLGTAATADGVAALEPAIAIIASGAVDRRLDLPGADLPHVAHAYDVLTGERRLMAGSVLVYGGGETGCEAAEYAAATGHDVTLVARSQGRLARRAQYVYRRRLLARLQENPRIRILTGHELVAILPDAALCRDQAGEMVTLPADQILLAAGRLPDEGLAARLGAHAVPVVSIGDCREVRRIGDAVHDAYAAVRELNDGAQGPLLTVLPC